MSKSSSPGRSGRERIDVSAPSGPLKQNPFAAFAARTLQQTPSTKTDAPPATEASSPEPSAAPPVSPAAAPPVPPAAAPAVVPPAPAPPATEKPKTRSLGRLVLRRETKHRGGKTVVVISGFSALGMSGVGLANRLRDVEKHLKNRLGCGGAHDVATAEILIQGDRPEAIAELLRDLGYTVAGVTGKPGSGR